MNKPEAGESYIRVTGGPYKYGDTVTYEWNVSERVTGQEYVVVAMQCYQDKDGDGQVSTDMFGPDIVYAAPLEKPDGEIRVADETTTSEWTNRGGPAVARIDLCIYGWEKKQQTIRTLASDEFPVAGP